MFERFFPDSTVDSTYDINYEKLYKEGYQACDIGHIDIEYEWFLMGATSKVAIHDKYTNEAINGTSVSKIINDKKYQSEIVAQIGV